MTRTTNGPDTIEEPELTRRERLADWLDQVRFYIYATVLLLLLIVGALWQRILITVPAGNHAVLFDRFAGGTRTQPVFGEGLHIVWPWNKLILYETRLQQREMKYGVLSEEGLDLGITLAIRYTPVVSNLGYLHRDIGPDYFDKLIKPDIQGHLRHTFGGRPAHEIYSSAREVLQEISRVPLLGRTTRTASPGVDPVTEPYVHLEEIKLVAVELPRALVSAINEKQKQEQLTLEYKYRLQREDKEAERKRTEAAGIRDFSLIAGKLSGEILRWRGIDATLDLAKSSNSKVIIIGGSQSGTPVMLNVTDTPAAETPAAAPPPAESKRAAAPKSVAATKK
jgi:regulator of protease activity HflC (stomatin/prohibitin superfamily)